jgi:hypothetical protein
MVGGCLAHLGLTLFRFSPKKYACQARERESVCVCVCVCVCVRARFNSLMLP